MSLAEAITPPQGRYDVVEAAYDGMDETDRAAFRGLIEDKDYPPAQIAQIMRKAGYEVDRKQVAHFREKVSLGKVKLA